VPRGARLGVERVPEHAFYPARGETRRHELRQAPDLVLQTVVRAGRTFRVRPHSFATNQLVRCPDGTLLTGGGTSLIGEPNGRPRNAPVVYTNGPVGNILPGEAQTWASEVANRSGQTFRYRQFALCATTRSIPVDDDGND